MMSVASTTDIAANAGIGEILAAQAAAFLAVLLAATAAHKWLDWGRTLRAVREFAGLPTSAAPAAAVSAGAVEISAAVLLITPVYRVVGALFAAVVLTVYLVLIVRSLLTGRRDVDCGCTFGRTRHALGAFEAARNAVLVLMALGVAISAARGGPAIAASQMIAAVALLALYAALDQVMAVQPMRRGTVL